MTNPRELERRACDLREAILDAVTKGQGPAHPAPSLSCADILTALYFRVMRLDPERPDWDGRDRLVFSKGHAAPALYAALALRGFFPREELLTLRRCGSRLQGHPDMTKTPGVDMTTGSLGNGLSIGVGMALGEKLKKSRATVFVLMGDGEIQEGSIWEGALSAGKYRLDNLVAVLDYNHIQSSGFVEDSMPLEPLARKWESFGFRVMEMNGHNMREIVDTLERAKQAKGQPVFILAHTTKGQGISYMENDPSWHTGIPTPAQYAQALEEIAAARAALDEMGGAYGANG